MADTKAKQFRCPSHWSLVQRLDHYTASSDANGCRPWIGAVDAYGYGILSWDGKTRKAHRLTWTIFHGAIEDDVKVCHACDIPACVAIEHLWIGSQADNIADRTRKGRQVSVRGVSHKRAGAKLTDEQVLAVRADPREQNMIATAYGITQPNVSLIKLRKTWRHL